jgi:hypothetical protein
VDIARFVVDFDAGLLAIAAFGLDVPASLLAVLMLDVLATLAGAFACLAPRTSLIALVCSSSVIRNS